MTMTQSPQFRWGVNVGLCLPRSTWATRLASRPSGCPAASTRYQRCGTSSLRRLNVVIPDRPGWRRSHPAARERLDLAGPLVHHLDLHSLTDDPQRPPPHAPWERLGRDGPRLTTEEQVVQGGARYRDEVRLERLPVHQHTGPFHFHFDGLGADADEVLHAASKTATVSTCAVWGNRSNARTATSR